VLFALPMSVGAGLGLEPESRRALDEAADTTETWRWTELVPSAFFDLTYAQIGLGYGLGVGRYKQITQVGATTTEVERDYSLGFLQLSLLGQYPFIVKKLRLFPAAGFVFRVCLTGSMNGVEFDGTDKADFSNIHLQLGGGADYDLSETAYVRLLALFGINLNPFLESASLSGDYYWSGLLLRVHLLAGYRIGK
jgi:hypothetical protein